MLNTELRALEPSEHACCVGCGGTISGPGKFVIFVDHPSDYQGTTYGLDHECRSDLENRIRYGGL